MYIKSAKQTFGTYNPKIKKKCKKSFVWYNDKCYQMKKLYKTAQTTHRRIKTKSSLNMIIDIGKKYRNQVKSAKKVYSNDLNKQIMQLKKNDARAYWQLLNSNVSKNEIDISVDVLTTHFIKLHAGDEGNSDVNDSLDLQHAHAQQPLNVENLNEKISDDEIIKAAKAMKNNKACGIDSITNEYIKHSLPALLPLLNKLFNMVLDTGIIPDDWVTGIIVPLHKTGDKKDPSNYRGITLLSCLGKLFTSILNSRLSQLVNDNEIILENQTGFRQGYSTADHCFLLKQLIDLCKMEKKKLFCAFVDFKQAFDRVWRLGLWYKLNYIGIRGKCFDVIVNMYKNIKSCVMANGIRGDYFVSNIGVRQGENLSPLLFSLYLNDLESYLEHNGSTGLTFDTDVCNQLLRLFVIMYADDTVLFANSPRGLQKVLHSFSCYCREWKLTVNVSKTKVVVFGARKYKGKTVFKYEDSQIEIVDEFKYLGVIFSFNGMFKTCRKFLYGQAQKAMFSLLCKCRKFNLPLKVCLELFDRLIVPILTYGSEIWSFEEDQLLEKLHLKFCKYIAGLKTSTPNVMVYGELGRFPLSIHLKLKALPFCHKLVNSKTTKLSHRVYDLFNAFAQ